MIRTGTQLLCREGGGKGAVLPMAELNFGEFVHEDDFDDSIDSDSF